jgi:hypothetical protein
MALVVALFLGLCGMVVFYAFGQGGPVGALIFFAILMIGVLVKITHPVRARLRP